MVLHRFVDKWNKFDLWEAVYGLKRLLLRRVFPILCGLLVCTALWAEARQAQLTEQVIRFHVIANSDSQADQALKLAVRDALLDQLSTLLTGRESPQEAACILEDNLTALEETAAARMAAAGYGYPVRVTLSPVWYPTRWGEDGALPAGTYQSLRVILGEGAGRNWWGVVFPALCLPAASDTAVSASTLSRDSCRLITEAEGSYQFQFKALELWGSLKALLAGH